MTDGSTLRPHHAGATGAALASGSTSGGFQDGHSGLPGPTVLQPIWLPTVVMVSDEGRRQLRSATSRTCVVRLIIIWVFEKFIET